MRVDPERLAARAQIDADADADRRAALLGGQSPARSRRQLGQPKEVTIQVRIFDGSGAASFFYRLFFSHAQIADFKRNFASPTAKSARARALQFLDARARALSMLIASDDVELIRERPRRLLAATIGARGFRPQSALAI